MCSGCWFGTSLCGRSLPNQTKMFDEETKRQEETETVLVSKNKIEKHDIWYRGEKEYGRRISGSEPLPPQESDRLFSVGKVFELTRTKGCKLMFQCHLF